VTQLNLCINKPHQAQRKVCRRKAASRQGAEVSSVSEAPKTVARLKAFQEREHTR